MDSSEVPMGDTQPAYNRKPVRLAALALLGIVALAACKGANQEAGSARDEAAAAAKGEPYDGSGPNERIGKAQDRAADAEQSVKDADADALKAQGRNVQRQADVEAARMDEKSKAIHDEADEKADALNEQAKAIRK